MVGVQSTSALGSTVSRSLNGGTATVTRTKLSTYQRSVVTLWGFRRTVREIGRVKKTGSLVVSARVKVRMRVRVMARVVLRLFVECGVIGLSSRTVREVDQNFGVLLAHSGLS
jgi:hypothetical protein